MYEKIHQLLKDKILPSFKDSNHKLT